MWRPLPGTPVYVLVGIRRMAPKKLRHFRGQRSRKEDIPLSWSLAIASCITKTKMSKHIVCNGAVMHRFILAKCALGPTAAHRQGCRLGRRDVSGGSGGSGGRDVYGGSGCLRPHHACQQHRRRSSPTYEKPRSVRQWEALATKELSKSSVSVDSLRTQRVTPVKDDVFSGGSLLCISHYTRSVM